MSKCLCECRSTLRLALPEETSVTIRNLTTRARAGQMTRQRRHHEYHENDVRVTILASVNLDPYISNRKLKVSTGIPKSTILRILKARKYHIYHITLTQALLPANVDRRFEFCGGPCSRSIRILIFLDL